MDPTDQILEILVIPTVSIVVVGKKIIKKTNFNRNYNTCLLSSPAASHLSYSPLVLVSARITSLRGTSSISSWRSAFLWSWWSRCWLRIRSDSLFDDEERILKRHLVRALFLLFHKVDVTDLFLSEICCHIFILPSLQYLQGIARSKSCLKGRWVCASVVAAALRSSLQSEVFLTISWRSGPGLSSLPGRFAVE